LSWGGGHIDDQYTNIIIVRNHSAGIMNKLNSLKLVVSEDNFDFGIKLNIKTKYCVAGFPMGKILYIL